jgi:hypothetical protein
VTVVPVAVFRPIAERWVNEQESPEAAYHALAAATGLKADSWRKRFSETTYKGRTGTELPYGWWSQVALDERDVDAFLTAADLPHAWYEAPLDAYRPARLEHISAKVRLPGERGRIKRHSRAALLTRDQVYAVHKLHIDGGMSMREIARQGYEQWGYASAKSCLNSVCDLLDSYGLKRRDRIEATIKASTTHGRGARADKAAYKRWHRKAFGPWASDGTDEERQARFELLRANHDRRSQAAA